MTMEYAVLDELQEGVCILDAEEQVEFCNRRLTQWLHKSLDELRGKKLSELFPRFADPHIYARMKMLRVSHAPIVFSSQIHAYLFPCPLEDGSGYRLQHTTVTSFQDGRVVFSVQDVTDSIRQIQMQKEGQRRLKDELAQRYVLEKQNTRLIAAMDQAVEAVMICNERGQFQYVNHAFVQQTGWTQEEALHVGSYAILRADQQDIFESLVADALRLKQKWQGHYQVQCKDGTVFTADMSIAPIEEEDGCTHVVVIQEDISEYILLEEQYRQTQKQEALATLVGGIAHDFNNLLSGMLGHLYLASREVKELPKTLGRLVKLQDAVHETADIVKQLMTFSRSDQIDARDFPLQSFVKEVVKLLEHSVPENIRFFLDFEQHPFPIHGDPELLQQALMNMVQNAVEACASQPQAEIRIALSALDLDQYPDLLARYPALQYGSYAQLLIEDSGEGIHGDHLNRIFDPFFTTKQLGSGLGLSTVMGCVRHHHGVIDVCSELGQGTKIYLFLPLNAKHAEPVYAAVANDMQKIRILMADDDPMVRETTSELLRDMGHEVSTAENGEEAVEVFVRQPDAFDVILMDMVMPRLNGPAAVRKIRAIRDDIPVIFVTAYDRSIRLADAAEFSRATLITKPCMPEDMNPLLTRVLEKDWQGDSEASSS